jgi:DNA-binding MarR family transcriptional regulator
MQIVVPSVTVMPERSSAEEQLATQLGALLRLMHPLKAAVARETAPGEGVDRSAVLLLFPLQHGPLRAGALAELCHADPSTISRQVAELVRRGLVRREPDPSDGRATLVAATAAGRAACDRFRVLRRQLLAAAVADWTDEDLATFAVLLGRFNDALDTAYRPPGPRGVEPAFPTDRDQDTA